MAKRKSNANNGGNKTGQGAPLIQDLTAFSTFDLITIFDAYGNAVDALSNVLNEPRCTAEVGNHLEEVRDAIANKRDEVASEVARRKPTEPYDRMIRAGMLISYAGVLGMSMSKKGERFAELVAAEQLATA